MELTQVLIRERGASIRSDPRTLSFVLDALEQNLKSKIKLKERGHVFDSRFSLRVKTHLDLIPVSVFSPSLIQTCSN